MTTWVPALADALVAASAVLALGLAAATARNDGARRLVSAMAPGARPPGRAGVVAWIGTRKPWRRLARRAGLERRLELAGRPWDPFTVMGAQVGTATIGGCASLLLLGGRGVWAAAALFTLAAVFPEAALSAMARRRRARIDRATPDLVELLLVTAEAGAAPSVALRRAGEVLRGPLGEEVRRAVAEIELGVPWRHALGHLVRRTEAPGLSRAAAAIARTARFGTPLRPTLRAIADDLRADERARAEEAARRAPVKMLFPLVFLILPAFLLLTVGPVVLATLRALQAG